MTQPERLAAFRSWKCAPLGEEIGRGRYGSVVACGAGVAKVLRLEGKDQGARRQAYREHVVALLQSLLLLDGVTVHIPFHYGAQTALTAQGEPTYTMYMERFEGSLQDFACEYLRGAEDWLHLAFQVAHAIAALGLYFGVSHNDLYPRNVLVSARAPEPMAYDVEGQRYCLAPRFLAVVTDYGIASGALLGAPTAPEVAASTQKQPRAAAFALMPPHFHILQYDPPLPTFSRDLFVMLKWVAYGQNKMPSAPLGLRLWAFEAMHRMDRHLQDFARPAALLTAFHHLFHAENLARFGLPALDATGGGSVCVLRGSGRRDAVRKATAALEELAQDEAEWVRAIRASRSAVLENA